MHQEGHGKARPGAAGCLHSLRGPGEGPPDPVRPQYHSWKQDLGAASLPAWTQGRPPDGPVTPPPRSSAHPTCSSGSTDTHAPCFRQSLPGPHRPSQPRECDHGPESCEWGPGGEAPPPPTPAPPGHARRDPATHGPLTEVSDARCAHGNGVLRSLLWPWGGGAGMGVGSPSQKQ